MLSNLFGTVGHAPKAPSRSRSPRRFRPAIEQLEDRTLLKGTFAVTTTNDSGPGSLRWAIEQANAVPGPDSIVFQLRDAGANAFEDVDSALAGGDRAADVFVIRPLTALPPLRDPTGGTSIDGRTQAAFGGNTNRFGPEVVIDGGSAAGDPVEGLTVWMSDSNRILGLNIHSFRGTHVSIVGGDNNVLAGNYIGTDATGTKARGNLQTGKQFAGGVLIAHASERNVIGSDGDGINDPAERNVISGNLNYGVALYLGGVGSAPRYNTIRGNYIGTNARGEVADGLGNRGHGILLVGGTAAVANNSPNANAVEGNRILGNASGPFFALNASFEDNALRDNQVFASAPTVGWTFDAPAGRLTLTGDGGSNALALSSDSADRHLLNGEVIPFANVLNTRAIVVKGGAGNDTLDASGLALFTGAVELSGENGNDTLIGAAGNDVLLGGAGTDTLDGRGSVDTLDGGGGVDAVPANDGDVIKVGRYQISGAIGIKWSSAGGEGGFLGAPLVNERVASDGVGRFQHFQGGSIYHTPATGVHLVYGAIREKWASMGSERGPLGYPTTDELPSLDGKGRISLFQNGAIYWSPQTGAHAVYGAIYTRWASMGREASPLGAPLTDETGTPDGVGRFNHFQGGSIYWTPMTGAHVIYGAIRDQWAGMGWELSPLGYPTSDELPSLDGRGRVSQFQNGAIYWSPATGARAVYGAIYTRWASTGWEAGMLGAPLTDELGTPDGVGRFNHFEHGSIYWTPRTGAHLIYGAIRDQWESMGWERSSLGYPTTDELPAADGVGRVSNFEHGQIYWSPSTGVSVKVHSNNWWDRAWDFAEGAWGYIENVGEWFGDRALLLLDNFAHWVENLDNRFHELARDVWVGISSNPFDNTSWNAWRDVLIDVLEIHGVGELYQVYFEFVKANTRGLTEQEAALALSVYGTAIDLNRVRIDEYALLPLDPTGGYVGAYVINTMGVLDPANFIHELAHVLQYQELGLSYIPRAISAQQGDGYGYGGAAKDDMSAVAFANRVDALRDNWNAGMVAFNLEQQAEIVAHYYIIREAIRDPKPTIRLQSIEYSLAELNALSLGTKRAYLATYAHFVDQVSSYSEADLSALS